MIIIIDGCPSVGKTSIIKELQNLYQKPFLSLGIDRFWAMIPEQYKELGSKADEGYLFVQSHDEYGKPVVNIKRGPFAEHLDRTIPKIICSLADCNHDVIADVIFVNDSITKRKQTMKSNLLAIVLLCCFSACCLYSSQNTITLQSYESHIDTYIADTPSVVSDVPKEWIDKILTLLPIDSKIIEIGSASGRDAHYIESYGFTVECTDAVHNFVLLLQQKGHKAYFFNVLTDDFLATYDLVFANGVFLHFTPTELSAVLNKIYNALSPKGILAFSVKKGEGEEWSTAKLGSERYFHYWQLDTLKEFLEPFFKITTSFMDERFLYIIAIKS